MTPLYGSETAKALKILGQGQTPRTLIKAFAEVKLAAIQAQQESSSLYPDLYFHTLCDAAREIIRGDHDKHFPLPLTQGGAGTSLHMNICEVLAALANKSTNIGNEFKAQPLEDLARFQSTNDTFSTAVILMSFRILEEMETRVIALQEGLVYRETLYQEWLMCGRTEMQDALPMTLGQLFGAWAGPVERDRWRLNKVTERLRQIPLGGTAIGTGYSAPRDYVFAAEKALRRITGLPLCRSQNLCDQVAHTDALAEAARAMGLCASNLFKWTGDLLIYSSSFLAEIPQEEQQYGSTIMPSKSNPVLIELIRGLSLDVISSSDLISRYSSEGQLQLNAYLPFMAEHMIRISENLGRALTTASELLLPALKPDRALMEKNLVNSAAMVNSLRDVLGYGTIKELLPELKKAGLNNRSELILWLKNESGIEEIKNIRNLDEHFGLQRLTTGA
ncbi:MULTISPECIES: lyase family protein [unclassified Oceanispirochaeta]|uniref:lyase family protein n=1 Tax=unclassified Oceanispirochaeta TaxID=2635722 RepID=UPI000E098A2A|nr:MULTISPECIES: lyase family protein [unclassified Oceanispirochaeta]MBF9016485.1 fumarate lyase [Oceanispirochaeta sp. M2]NPD72947.1 fumarate lyase [Oceanispirochaeta sp. M1]RDG31521.1 fumarate lyase [Oceanispirochaeta sp. M1]